MRILAIDPGCAQSAWVSYEDGRPKRADKVANDALLKSLRAPGVEDDGALLAIEMIQSFGMAVGREVFETCLWVGAFREAWVSRGGRCRLVYRKDVKLFLCESARATDANIRASIIDRYGPGKEAAIGRKSEPGPLYGLKGDTWSALAVAMTAEEFERQAAKVRSSASESEARVAEAAARGQAF